MCLDPDDLWQLQAYFVINAGEVQILNTTPSA
jgi:hypothetical protein